MLKKIAIGLLATSMFAAVAEAHGKSGGTAGGGGARGNGTSGTHASNHSGSTVGERETVSPLLVNFKSYQMTGHCGHPPSHPPIGPGAKGGLGPGNKGGMGPGTGGRHRLLKTLRR